MKGALEATSITTESSHPRAIPDWEVKAMLELHDQGWGYKRIGDILERPKSTVQHIITGRNRTRC